MDTLPEGIGSMFARKGERRAANCPEHGAYEAVNILRNIWSGCPACEVARQALAAAEAADRRRKEAEAKHLAILDSSAIPRRFCLLYTSDAADD